MSQTLDKLKKREFKSEHLKLLRNLRVTWVNCEAGAPMIDWDMRYGSPKVYEDMARILDWSNPKHLSTEQVSDLDNLDAALLGFVIELFLDNAEISPGVYTINNTMIEDHPSGKFVINDDGSGSMEIPSTRTMQFMFTDDHLKLLRRASWKGAFIDPKRPYGDMSYFYLDMADALGVPTERDDDGRPKYTNGQIRRFDKLHGEMVFALQTFFQHADLHPCTFIRKGNSAWRKIDPSQAIDIPAAELAKAVSDEPVESRNSDAAESRNQVFGSLMDFFRRGENPTKIENMDTSILLMSNLIAAQTETPLLYATRASHYKQAKLYKEAIEDYSKAIEMGKSERLLYMWYEGRAAVYDLIGRETEALSDYTEAIRLEPKHFLAHYCRGRIYNSRKESKLALADFNVVIESNPNWNSDVYYSRGVASLLLGDSLSAAKDFKFYLDSDKWQDPAAPYAVLLGYVAFRKSGKHLDAQALVATANEKLKVDKWPAVVVQYILGKDSADRVIASVHGTDDLTEAHWFIGAKLLFDCRVEDAVKHLKWVVEKGNKSMLDYELAKSELSKLSN